MSRWYNYVGPSEIAARPQLTARTHITSQSDPDHWRTAASNRPEPDGNYTVTFVVLDDGLWIADRHSEHVACARSASVLSAGEMRFAVGRKGTLEVLEISNQSTGYCPEPESWPAVAKVLNEAGITHPGQFTTSLVFRRCETCLAINIVKLDDYTCAMCARTLPVDWNFNR